MSSTSLWDILPRFYEAGDRDAPAPEVPAAIAHVQAEAEIMKAQVYAQQLMEEAEMAAQQLRSDAIADAELIRQQAHDEAYRAATIQAREDVEAELNAKWNERVESLRSDLDAVIAAIEGQRTTMWRQTEKDIVSFSIEMAKKIIKAEIQENPKVIAEVIKHALRRVVNKEHIRIRISPLDLETVRGQREDLLLVLDGATNLDIVDDRRIEQGGCVIETPAGNIDARIDTQLERTTEALEVE